mmetsp:Transcript_23605/g.58527  ORF Transcript_23605/g.58527 Transcript_23605/m.58527 type:complete len:254 (-) Transcript_23605:893-1654(-)
MRHLVVGPRVQSVVANPAIVVAVNHLSHEQAVRVDRVAGRAELAPEVRRYLVRHVKPPPVNPNLLNPKLRHVKDMLLHCGFRQVEPWQHRMALPAIEAEPSALDSVGGYPPFKVVPARAYMIPVSILARRRALCTQICKRKVSLARVVEYPVQNNLDVELVQLRHDFLEERHVTQTPIDRHVIVGIVPVCAALEEGGEIHGVDAEVREVLVVRANLLESRDHQRLAVIDSGGAEVSERKDLIKDSLVGPLGEV